MFADGTTNLTIRRCQFQNFWSHGIQLGLGANNILIENNIFNGSSRAGCAETLGGNWMRAIDVYEASNMTVRNNTFAGHGYMWKNPFMTYSVAENAEAHCTNTLCNLTNYHIYNNLVYDIKRAQSLRRSRV